MCTLHLGILNAPNSVCVYIQDECSMPLNFLYYAVPYNKCYTLLLGNISLYFLLKEMFKLGVQTGGLHGLYMPANAVTSFLYIFFLYSFILCIISVVLNLLTSADPHWITTGSRGPLSHFYDLKLKTIYKITQTIHNKQIHKLRNILFNSQTKKYTKILVTLITNRYLIFNIQFQIPSLLQSVLKFSISDFAFFTYIYFINLLGKVI
jgi:hypothetical protein